MSSIWTKARKNTPEIDCGLCGYPTCGTFARSLVIGKTMISNCPILLLESFNDKRTELESVNVNLGNITKPAPEQPEGGVLLSKPCMDDPNLRMAEMRIFNGVVPGSPQRFGVLDPVILCWLLDCASSRYQDMRCSKELAYAWGEMEEIKVHILRDGRVRMRRARGKEHALEAFRIIERTVIGAIVCNCCGHDLFSVLMGFAPPSSEEVHTVLKAGSTLSINPAQVDWTRGDHSMDVSLVEQMFKQIELIQSNLDSQLDSMIDGDFKTQNEFNARQEICGIIDMMFEPSAQDYVTMFLKGLAHAFFLDNALEGLEEIRQLVENHYAEANFVTDLLKNTKENLLEGYKIPSKGNRLVLLVAHAHRVAQALRISERWMT
ncbi:MAG: (Fe-S)-binding protein [Promethearchaeota archaeon]